MNRAHRRAGQKRHSGSWKKAVVPIEGVSEDRWPWCGGCGRRIEAGERFLYAVIEPDTFVVGCCNCVAA